MTQLDASVRRARGRDRESDRPARWPAPPLPRAPLHTSGAAGSLPSGDPSFPAGGGLRPDRRAHRGTRADLPRRPSSTAGRSR